MSGTSDIGIKFGEEQWGGIRTFNVEKHLFNSPISYVENVETPALILCGELDYRCPIEQAEQYFVALKRLNKNVQFVRYPDQNHQMLDQGFLCPRLDKLALVAPGASTLKFSLTQLS